MISSAFQDELDYWTTWLQNKGQDTPDEYYDRLNPELSLQPEIRALIPPNITSVYILDVGAGPLTHLGKVTDVDLHIIAIDALAQEYDELLDSFNIVPPIRTRYGMAEDLKILFKPDTFDIVCFRECLEHCTDPIAVLCNALTVTKFNGSVLLQHEEFLSKHEQYSGLHQWDLYMSNSCLVIANETRTEVININSVFKNVAQIRGYHEGPWITTTLKKTIMGEVNV